MNRKERTETLIKVSGGVAEKMAKEILCVYQVDMVEPPHNSLIMVKIRENAQRSLFYIGELVATECKVRIHHSYGFGIVQGYQSDLAYHLAIIDAAFQEDLPETIMWNNVLETEKNKLDQKKVKHDKKILQTKVDFETMNIEV
jgi:alpha-D-ribose 1-methylphosphonate 5-triphosphate synthase subunit PhnG